MKPCRFCGRLKHNQYTVCEGKRESSPVRFPQVADNLTPANSQRVSDLADAACPRFILILHPNFVLPEGFHMGACNRNVLGGGGR